MKLFAGVWLPHYDGGFTPESGWRFFESVDVTRSLQFDTQLHGGYAGASFTVAGGADRSFYRYRHYLNAHVVVFDPYGDRIYEGWVTKVGLGKEGISVSLFGYFTKGAELIFDMIYPAVEYTKNWVCNPSFEVNVTDNWTLSGGTGAAATRDSAAYRYGSYCARLTQPSAGNALEFKTTILLSAETQYAFSMYVRNKDLTNGTPKLAIQENDPGTTRSEKAITAMSDDDFIRYELIITTQTGTTQATFLLNLSAYESPGEIYIDAVQVEQKGYVTGYCDGSLGAGYSWTGTPHNSPSERSASSYSVYDIVKDIVELIPEWQHVYPHIANATYQVGAQDFTDKKVKEALEEVLKFGYREDDFRPIYFAMYNDRIPMLYPEPTPTTAFPEWFISVGNILRGRAALEMDMGTVFNKVYAAYDNTEEGPSKTLPAEDNLSQNVYGVKEGLLENGGNVEGLALATDLRDMALARYRYPRQVLRLDINGLVRNMNGYYAYPYQIRAGQRILVTDLDVFTVNYGTISGQVASGLSGFVLRTTYSANKNMLSVTFGTLDTDFEITMGRLGLSGGLR